MAQQFRPRSVDDLKDMVRGALAEKAPLRVVGAGSKDCLGRPLDLDSVHLDALSGIGMYEPAELVMTAHAGTPIAEIEARLADSHQQLAFEPPDYGALLGSEPDRGTIGGALACNLSGPRRIKAGAARDHFLGLQAVTGRGDLIKAGGRVVKNVTGYDLCKLLAGSFGTLAVMTEVTVKVLPAAEETLTLLVAGLEPAAALGVLRTAMASAYDASGAAYLPPAAAARSELPALAGASGVAALRLEGPGASLRHRADGLRVLVRSAEIGELGTADSATFWREVRDVALLSRHAVLWRISVAPSAGAELVATLETVLDLQWQADWAGGLLWLALDAADESVAEDGGAAAIRTALMPHGGHASLIRADAALRARVEVFQPQAAPLARLGARVKESFDPERILNPGRMYAGI